MKRFCVGGAVAGIVLAAFGPWPAWPLRPRGRPIPDLFRADLLHLSRAGSAVWSEVIAAAFAEVLAGAREESPR